MRKLLLVLPLVLAACGENAMIEDAVRANLKDPDSAKFKDLIHYGQYACVTWNSKNSLGGYGEWDTAELRKENSRWVVLSMEAYQPEVNCSIDTFKRREDVEKAVKKLTQ